jgi:hypothetical protein
MRFTFINLSDGHVYYVQPKRGKRQLPLGRLDLANGMIQKATTVHDATHLSMNLETHSAMTPIWPQSDGLGVALMSNRETVMAVLNRINSH